MSNSIHIDVKLQMSVTENGWLLVWSRKPKNDEKVGINGRVEVLCMCNTIPQLKNAIVRATKEIKE